MDSVAIAVIFFQSRTFWVVDFSGRQASDKVAKDVGKMFSADGCSGLTGSGSLLTAASFQ